MASASTGLVLTQGCGWCRFIGGLGGLHVFFTSQNTTTYEHFRSRYNAQGNPYDRGILRNWQEVLCTPIAERYPERLPGRVSLVL